MSYLLLNKELTEAHELEGKYKGQLIITGSSECLWSDYLKAIDLTEKEDLMCVNLSAICFHHRRINHLVTLHHGTMKNFYAAAMIQRTEREEYPRQRRKAVINKKFKKILTHSISGNSKVDLVWDIGNPGGTSGLFATQIALALGYEKIILCGIPINNTRRFYDSPNHKFKYEGISQQEPWQIANKKFDNRVRSMSGKTAELLGKPDKKWLTSS
jgi:hypothetical protein